MAESATVRAVMSVNDMNGSMPDHIDGNVLPAGSLRPSRATVGALVAVTIVFAVAYLPNFQDLQTVWNTDPNYSHGYLIIPIALVILWRRLSDVPAEPSSNPIRRLGGVGSS